jgi:hypothetical protein
MSVLATPKATGRRRTIGGLLTIPLTDVVTQALGAAPPVVVHVSTDDLSTGEWIVAILTAVGGVAAGVGAAVSAVYSWRRLPQRGLVFHPGEGRARSGLGDSRSEPLGLPGSHERGEFGEGRERHLLGSLLVNLGGIRENRVLSD